MTGYKPHTMPEAAYPVVKQAFEKPTFLHATHPLIAAIIAQCYPTQTPQPIPVENLDTIRSADADPLINVD